MNTGLAVTIAIAAMSIIVIPTLVMSFRLAVRWKGIEDKLENMMRDKDRVHVELYSQMREDREATNRRLRWLEENLWKNGARHAL